MEKLLNLELARSHNFHLKLARYLFLHLGTLYSHKDSNFPLVMLTGLIKCDYRLPKTNRSQMRIFSIDNVLKTIFVLRWWLHDPSKHLLVFKTSSRRLEDMSWRRLQHVFSVTILRLPRRLEDVLKTFSRPLARRLEDVLEDEKLLRWRRLEDVLKTCLEDVLKTYLEDVFKTSWR